MVAPPTPAVPLIVEGEAALAGVTPTAAKSMDRIIKTEMTRRPIANRVLVVLVYMSSLPRTVFAKRILIELS
jgi:hypothetical protein